MVSNFGTAASGGAVRLRSSRIAERGRGFESLQPLTGQPRSAGRPRSDRVGAIELEVSGVHFPKWLVGVVAGLIVLGVGLEACGSSSEKSTPTVLKISVSESGKKTSFTVPDSVEGGLVEV